jgi:hypothetical protein
MKLDPLTVRWASGAQAAISNLQVCGSRASKRFQSEFTFLRPLNVPGQALDAQVALEIERNEVLAEQAQAQDRAATLDALNAINQQNAAKQPLHCSSRQVGDTVQTDCH